jgi:hypothetical protein
VVALVSVYDRLTAIAKRGLDDRMISPGEAQELLAHREQLMRVGLLAVSERQDGCVSKTTALRIRELAHRTCWPDDSEPENSHE